MRGEAGDGSHGAGGGDTDGITGKEEEWIGSKQ